VRNKIIAGVAAGAIAAVGVAIPASAISDTNADLYVLHAIPGTIVDVYVNGDLTLDNFEPRDLTDALDLPAGTYTVAITESDAADDSAPIIPAFDLPLEANMSYTAVAHLDAAGDPTASLFTNDLSTIPAGQGKLTVRHTAAAGSAIWLTFEPGAQPTILANATLEAFPNWADSTGEATLERLPDGSRVIDVNFDAPVTADSYREVWLITSDATALVSLGIVEGTSGQFTVPEGLDIDRYDLVDISEEPFDGDPAHSGDSIVRGQLTDNA
jgi:hypothetical protein